MNKKNYKGKLNIEDERQMSGLDFGDMPEKLKEEYYEIQSEILSTTRLDENSEYKHNILRKSRHN